MRASVRPGARLGGRTAGAAAGLALGWWWFSHWRPPTFILTSFRHLPPLAPFYGFFIPQAGGGAWAAAAVLIAGLAGAALMAGRRTWMFVAYAFLLAATLRFSVRAARVAELPGSEFTTYPGEEVIYDAARIGLPLDFLRDYTALQDNLSLHGRTKPPGFALLHYALFLRFGDDLAAVGSALTILASLIVLPGYFLGRLLRGRDQDGRACALLLACLPGSVLFGAVSLDAVFAVVAASAFALAMLEARRPRALTRVALGLVLGLGMMLSYSTFLTGFFVLVLLVGVRRRTPSLLAIDLSQILAACAEHLLLLYLYPGFDALACYRNARRLNATLMTGIIGRDLAGGEVWRYASIGNLLAFLLALGPAIAGFLIPLRGKSHAASAEAAPPGDPGVTSGTGDAADLSRPAGVADLSHPAGAAFALTLLAACAHGLYLMETERTLLFLAAPALLPAILDADFKPIPAAALCGAQAIAMELLAHTLW